VKLKPKTELSDDAIRELPDKRAALRATITFAGKSHEAIAFEIGLDPSALSKMLKNTVDPQALRHFPQEKENLLMDVCGNEILLRWMNLSRGYPTPRQVHHLEEENARLRQELEEVKADRTLIMNVFKQVSE
jgi:hypothetical protein